jgi:transposase-like protein
MFVSQTRDRIADLLAGGLSMAEVARRTGLAYTTVTYHRDQLKEAQANGDAMTPPGCTTHQEPELAAYLHPVTSREEMRRMLEAGYSRAAVARAVGVSKSTVTYHARRLGLDVDERAARRYDWDVVQRYYDAGHTVQDCVRRFGFSRSSWSKAVKRGDVVARPQEMPIDELLAASRSRVNLKRRLISAGLLRTQCEHCGIHEWQGMPLSLQLHHINGVRNDNRLENLALLCPNCHSQTKTWAGRNGRGKRPSAAPVT